MIRDIEYWIDLWSASIQTNLQTYIDQSNTDHATSSVQLIDFDSDSFYTLDIPADPPIYPIYYMLYPNSSPTIDALHNTNVNTIETVNLEITIKEDGTNTMLRRGHRYKTMLIRLFNDIILKGTPSCEISSLETISLIYETGAREQKTGLSWVISLPY